MKAAVIYSPGGAEQFQLEERPVPQPTVGTVLVKVKAFGLNRSELMTRKGMSPSVKFPRVLGIECVGEVVLDPSGALQPGQKIAALMGGMGRDFDGSYAEYTVLPKSIVFPFESTLPWEQLGAFPEMFQTVNGSLHFALKIEEGQTLLIRGGTSSIGMLAAQLARNKGCTVIATTRNSAKEKQLLDNGASYVVIDDGAIASKVKAIFPEGVDKVLELVGVVSLQDSLKCTKKGGSVCMTGILSEKWSIDNFEPMSFIPSSVNLTVYGGSADDVTADMLQEFINSVEAGAVSLNVSKVFPLSDIAKAHALMDSNQATGKIVVVA